jgi:methylamine dehydrogenase light chain
MKWLDSFTEGSTRAMARRTSRRSVLSGLGALLVGAASLPLLPIARGEQPAPKPASGDKPAGTDDPSSCDYWRHCAIDGFLCSCCGGSESTCPPGTEMSAVTWIGTCHNPADKRDYIISYNDCCGKSSCGRCFCNRNERDTPLYVPYQSNDYNWCSGSSKANVPYHCSTSRIVGFAG